MDLILYIGLIIILIGTGFLYIAIKGGNIYEEIEEREKDEKIFDNNNIDNDFWNNTKS